LRTHCTYLLLFLVLGVFYKAQTSGSVFLLKPVVGFNACQIHGDAASGYNKPGLNGGLVLNTRFTKKYSLDLGFIYTQKGAWKNQNPDKGDYNFFRVNVNFLEMPLLLNVQLNQRYFMTLGPSIGYLLNFNVHVNGIDYSSLYTFEKFEFGSNFGLGRRMKGNFLVEVRTNNSFLPILRYGRAANAVYFPNPVARFFNKGLYNNILSAFIIYEIHPKKKSEPIQP
jgi:hypothetical protein